MVPTYSINPASVLFAQTQPTLSDVLTLLPDNTQKLISPRDVRDAIFSTWESSVIRYSQSDSIDYIGIDRNDVKKKIFLGKRQLSGDTIMDSTLLNSDTDIFLYNTKTDSNASQNLKMSFLGGTQSSLWSTAPYIGSVYVTDVNPYLSLHIVNPYTYGTLNLESGSSASITINNLSWPSQNLVSQMISNPGDSSPNDLLLVVRSGNVLLKKYSTGLINYIGATGGTTSIFGSPVLVNNKPLEYSNSTPIIATFGGIGIGMTFSKVPIVDMIDAMLYPYLEPQAVINLTSANLLLLTTPLAENFNYTITGKNILETTDIQGDTTVYYDYTIYKRSNDITDTKIYLFYDGGYISDNSGIVARGLGLQSQISSGSFNFPNLYIFAGNDSFRNIFTFSIQVTDNTSYFTSSASLEFVYPYFFGYADTYEDGEQEINDKFNQLDKKVDNKSSQVTNIDGSGYIYYCYPEIYGTLSTIFDDNDYLVYTHTTPGDWTYSVVLVDSPDGFWSDHFYYVYRKRTISAVPTFQDYKFNF